LDRDESRKNGRLAITARLLRGIGVCGVGAGIVIASSPLLRAQTPVAAAEPSRQLETTDSLLRRQIAVSFDHTPLGDAIHVLAQRAGVIIAFQHEVVDVWSPVTMPETQASLGELMDRLLAKTTLQLVALPGGHFSVVPLDRAAQRNGTIGGTVTDAKSKQPIRGAVVALDDTVKRVRTDERGRFTFTDVRAGLHRLTVRYVGYSRETRAVTVHDDSTNIVDVVLDPGVNTLDQVVVTATGEQRIRELGHTVTVINADSVVKAAPISSVTELLQGRVPGLTIVTTGGGLAGEPSVIRLRGASSLNLSSEPIVIVDGVRYRNQNTTPHKGDKDDLTTQSGFSGAMEANPLNHLNVNDIETVEVVHGPSASTLYGPDASNGVIVIKTKRGKQGKTQWNWYIHPLENSVPTQARAVRYGYQVWSHYYNNPTQSFPYTCTLQAQYQYRECVIDSVTAVKSVYEQPEFSVIGKAKPAFQYGANVSGGSEALSYYFSGDYSNKIGVVQFPSIVRRLVVAQTGVGSLDAMRNPSTLQSFNGHGSINAEPSKKLTLSAQIDHHIINQRLINPELLYGGSSQRPLGLPPGATGLPGDSLTDDFALNNIATVNAAVTTQDNTTQHTIIATQAGVHPVGWFNVDLSLGLDMNHATTDALIPATSADRTATVRNSYRNDLGRSATVNVGLDNDAGFLHFATHTGVNYNYTQQNDLTATGSGIPFGGSGLALASQTSIDPAWAESAQLGWYGEEILGFARQLYLNGGIRVDGTSRAGEDFNPTAQPKMGVSWVASESPWLRGRMPGVSELRLRSSWGSATRYPTEGMIEGYLGVYQTVIGNQQYVSVFRSSLADPTLGPETSKEAEYGGDATLFGRLALTVTRYTRRTNHQLQFVRLAPGLPATWTNLGDVSQKGFEATATLPVADNRIVRGDIQFSYSHTTSKLLSLGTHQNGEIANQLYHLGYPVDAIFDYTRLGVVDTVGGGPDGIYEDGERALGPLTSFGVRYPPTTFTLTPVFTVLNTLRISAMFDRQTGFVAVDEQARNCAYNQTCRAAYDPSTPILQQAKLVQGAYADWYRPGDFMRWRELTLSADVPQRFLRIPALHTGLTRATVSLQGRNLFLWNKYGGDPETYSDIRSSYAGGGIPQSRSWGFRFDITP